MIKKWVLILFFYFIFSHSVCFANNLKIQNVSLETRRATTVPIILVEFDVAWDNSWRNTENYDAVWLIFKASISGSGALQHCTTYSDTSGNNLGNTTGSNKDLEFIYPSDGAGVFIQRKASGAGTLSSTDARISISCPNST